MSLKKIITVPDETLRKNSEPIEKVGDNEKKLIKDLFETMYHNNGIGLAAIQVGVPKRVIVIDLSKDGEKKNPQYFVNPKIITNSDTEASYEEGCLSVPGQFAEISRPDKCKVKFLNYNWLTVRAFT